jgi:hypothetical protein
MAQSVTEALGAEAGTIYPQGRWLASAFVVLRVRHTGVTRERRSRCRDDAAIPSI